MLGRGPGCKNMSRYLILGRGGVLHVSCTSMRKKNSIITTDPFHIYYKIYYIFRSHGMPLFFSSKSMSKDMIIKMSCNEMAKEEKKSKFTCNVLMGMLRDWRGKCFFSQSNSHSRHIRWKKNRNLRSQLFFPHWEGQRIMHAIYGRSNSLFSN